jgi:WD40 repeat protein
MFALAGLGNGEKAYVFDANTFETIRFRIGQMGDYWGPVAWSPLNPHILAIGAYSGKLVIWDVATDEGIFTRQDGSDRNLTRITWSPRGDILFTDWDIFDTSDWHSQATYATDDDYSWQPTGEQIASVDDQILTIINATSGDTVQLLRTDEKLYAVAWSPDGSHIAYGGYDGVLHFVAPADIPAWKDRIPTQTPTPAGSQP